jgi:hypothetical protein
LIVWLVTFVTIAKLVDGMSNQIITCMFSTMVIFSIATMFVKKMEKNQRTEGSQN